MTTGDIHITRRALEESIQIRQEILANFQLIETLEELSVQLVEAYRLGGKALFCGNGGSASDAQHIAAELSGRFLFDREPLFAEALHVNTSYLTAVANDYGYDEVYDRAIRAMGRQGDFLFGFSTSGNSENVVRALKRAREIGMVTVALTGKEGGKMAEYADFLLNVPSHATPRIQEVHIQLGHCICEIVEMMLFKAPSHG